MRLDRPADAYNVLVLASLTSRFPPFLLPLILINLTGHMALSGGRVSGSLYVLKTGSRWRQLPRKFPMWSAVYDYFYHGSRDARS